MASYGSHRAVHSACVPTIVLVLCTGAWSAQFGGGSGTPDDPYQIWTPEQMNAVGADPNTWDNHFKLMADIDLGQYPADRFNVIGYDRGLRGKKAFRGVLDGGDHAILNFHYSCDSAAYVGLFGYVDGPGAEIRNLRLVSPRISTKNSSYVGSLVGALGRGTVADCHAIDVDLAGRNSVGGLIGEGSGIIEDSSSSGIVEGANCTGGLVGRSGGTIRRCCSSAIVLGNDYTGGLAGYGSDVTTDSYATGVVVGSQYVGGLKGEGADTITRCYAACLVIGTGYTGGLVGHDSGYRDHTTASFWDTEASRQDTSAGGVGKPTVLMQTVATFLKAGWDFAGETANGSEDIWWIAEGQDYPRLRWEVPAGQVFEPLQLSTLLEGTGTQDDPLLIYTAEELNLIGIFPGEWDKCFKLMADIDLRAYKGTDFNLIGPGEVGQPPYSLGEAFTGIFDGNGHTISNLTWTGDGTNCVGLFRRVDHAPPSGARRGSPTSQGELLTERAQIMNVKLISPHIGNTASDCVGALVGYLERGRIVNCCVQGGTVTGRDETGGLVGYNDWLGTVESCFSTTMVVGEDSVGGLIGGSQYSVVDCYATGMVIGHSCVGGLVGNGYDGSITCCYATGLVVGEELSGGLVACGPGNPVVESFWDTQTSGQTFSGGGSGKTTAEMQTADTFYRWTCCDSPWTIDDGNDYPRFWWENRPGKPISKAVVGDFLSGEGTEESPYLIYTAEELSLIGCWPCSWDKHFRLMADIDLRAHAGTHFHSIGYIAVDNRRTFIGTPFTGVFDGNGHLISNFTWSPVDTSGVGLFGYVDDPNAEIRNLGLVDPNLDAPAATDVGALVGYLRQGTVTGCFVRGGVVSGYLDTGGLVGYDLSGTITNCYSTAAVNGDTYVAGLAGAVSYGPVMNSYAAGPVMGATYAGGLVGGRGRRYDMGGNFWNTETSGPVIDTGGTGKLTVEMQTASTFIEAGWDFVGETDNGTEDIWWIDEGKDYPHLWWEAGDGASP